MLINVRIKKTRFDTRTMKLTNRFVEIDDDSHQYDMQLKLRND